MDKNVKKVLEFSKKTSELPKIIVIYGPTGAGKTDMSIDIAKALDSEIISTDSRQIFKEMDIGTGKITKQEMKGVPHHMLDIVAPNEEYSVGEFKREAEKIMEKLYSEGKIPMLVGGTGLYIDSIIYEFDIPELPADWDLRNKLEEDRLKYGNERLHKELEKIDPEYAKELHPNNYRYVMRAIEVKKLTGKSKTEFRQKKKLKYDALFFTPYKGDREELYNKINARVLKFEDLGVFREVKKLYEKYGEEAFGMKSIGYAEIIPYLKGEISKEKAIEEIQKNSRHYAKRQITWFKKYENN
ncbi:MAG: tRNA (adenosine(37)-N6)-dimethylallyltransferase MiaA [Candidatus Gracilibacteria bacterium]|nr:tRNA (adenosine(37)-N6)-dimethylallyltransferase MiaA [Candidatus Gracilibacteria bacterium]